MTELHNILNKRVAWEAWRDGRDILAEVPDEFHGWITDVWDGLAAGYGRRYHQLYEAYAEIRVRLPGYFTRGEFAAEAKKYGELTPWLFLLLDRKHGQLNEAIVKTLRPKVQSVKSLEEEAA